MVNENSVSSENAEVKIICEIMVASTMSSVLVGLFALLASSFRTRAALQAEILAFVTNWPFSTRTRPVACASSAPTDCCGSCCRASGRVGAPACRSCNPLRSSGGTGEPSLGIGPGNRDAAWEDQRWRRRFVI